MDTVTADIKDKLQYLQPVSYTFLFLKFKHGLSWFQGDHVFQR